MGRGHVGWRAGALVDRLISWPVGQRGDTLEAQRLGGSVEQKMRDSFSGGGWRPQVAGGGRESMEYRVWSIGRKRNEGRGARLARPRMTGPVIPTNAAEPRGDKWVW